ncbi:hypothetical protein [uncultured Roseivirga sp.]|uniref:hypothetical protein n=1 Tax=uncultured Roseivirga sp. TaxID=543088 RepID=UPI0030DD9270
MIKKLNIILLVLLFCSSCSQPKKSEEKAETIPNDTKSQSDYLGYLRVDLDKIMLYSDTINVFNLDKSLYAGIKGDTLKVGGNNYNLIEDRRDTLRKHISSYSFDPQYNIFILECKGAVDDFYRVKMNGVFKLISMRNKYAKFENLEDFVLSSMPDLSKVTPLRSEPNDTASIVDGYDEFYYLPSKLQGDWLFLECDKEYNDCPKEKESGWVKWRDSTGVLIRLAQTY